jgi:pyruvate/2-oxoglutarate dehydrogenase complex dihydrolipoamide acyltransferase (E2) component
MRVEVKMPSVSAEMESGTVVAWLKSVGDSVERGEPLAQIQTDKATLDLESRVTGTLSEILAQVDEEVAVGTVIATVETDQ